MIKATHNRNVMGACDSGKLYPLIVDKRSKNRAVARERRPDRYRRLTDITCPTYIYACNVHIKLRMLAYR